MEDGNGGMRSANAIVSSADANMELVPVAENNGLLAPMPLMQSTDLLCFCRAGSRFGRVMSSISKSGSPDPVYGG